MDKQEQSIRYQISIFLISLIQHKDHLPGVISQNAQQSDSEAVTTSRPSLSVPPPARSAPGRTWHEDAPLILLGSTTEHKLVHLVMNQHLQDIIIQGFVNSVYPQ